jgi:hypothetical protein
VSRHADSRRDRFVVATPGGDDHAGISRAGVGCAQARRLVESAFQGRNRSRSGPLRGLPPSHRKGLALPIGTSTAIVGVNGADKSSDQVAGQVV